MKTKRFFSLFLALTLVLSMFPVSADGSEVEYDLWVGGTRVTSTNASNVLGDGTVSYNPTDNILTLNGANITKEVTEPKTAPYYKNSGVYYSGSEVLKVNLIESNSITVKVSKDGCSSCGFFSYAGVTFTGGGSLTVTAGDDVKKGNSCYGILVGNESGIEAKTTIVSIAKSATKISVGYKSGKNLTVKGNLTGKSGSAEDTEGIYAKFSMFVDTGAVVNAESGATSHRSVGLLCGNTDGFFSLTINGGKVKAVGGHASGSGRNSSLGILRIGGDYDNGRYGIVIQDNGTVEGTGGSVSGDASSHYSCGISGNSIKIVDGEIKATGGSIEGGANNVESKGIYGGQIGIVIEGGKVNAIGGEVNNNKNEATTGSCGIETNSDMKIQGNAEVTAAGAKATSTGLDGSAVSEGIKVYARYASPILTVDGNAVVNASSGMVTCREMADQKSRAIFAKNIDIKGGTVTATAEETVGEEYGIYGMECGEEDENNITISGGSVTVVGCYRALNKAPFLKEGVTAQGSQNMDGTEAVAYHFESNGSFKWFKSTYADPSPTYGISISPYSLNFDALNEGYTEVTPVTVTIRNTGTVATGKLGIALEGTNAGSFACSPASITNIEPGGTAEFTVVPNSGLSEGTYTATVNITGENNIQGIITVNLRVNLAGDSGDPGDTGDPGDSGDSGDTGGSGGTVYTDDTDDAYDSDNNDEDSTSSSPIVEETQTAEISDDKNHEKIEVKTDKKKGTALVELKDTKQFSGKDIVVKMPKIKDVTNNILSVPVARLSKKPREGSISFETHIAGIVLPSNMLTDVAKITGKRAEIGVEETKKTDLPADVKEKIGNNPLVSFNLSIDNVPFRWNNKAAAIRVSIPYIPSEKELENPDGITAYHVDDRGKLIEMEDAKYDPKTKSVVFKSTQLGNYVVGFDEEKAEAEAEEVEELNFSDVDSGAWYYDAVNYLASKKITNGTGNGKFSPKAPLSRAQFIVMLMRSYGIEPDASSTDNFSDAGDAYYTDYLATAKRLGIAKGVGNNKFAPEKEISREAMFTLLYNALKVLDKFPEGDSGKTLSDFGDGAEVSDWAKEAVTEMVKNGTVVGFNDMLKPANGTNRAEMAQLLYKLLSIK